METSEIGFGSSWHWCTEAIFLSLKGITQAKQEWIAPIEAPDRLSEAVIIRSDPAIILRISVNLPPLFRVKLTA